MTNDYAEYAVQQAAALLAIDSPTGFTARAADWVYQAFANLGYPVERTCKGGILVDLAAPPIPKGFCWPLTRTRWARWSRKSRATAACA